MYLLPNWVFGEELFLDETVIVPKGMTGIFATQSALLLSNE